jgi:hypothetical protein
MKSFTAMFIAALLAACTTEVPVSTADANKPVEFTQQLPDMTSNEIYSSTRAWITETFMFGRAAVLDENRKTGHIALKAHIPYPCDRDCGNRTIQFTMHFSIEDGRLKLSFAHIRLSSPQTENESGKGEPIRQQKDLDVIQSEFARLDRGLHASLMGDESTTFLQ